MTYAIKPDADPPLATAPPKSFDEHRRRGKEQPKPPGRLVSLDAFRGFIMVMLAANGFGLYALSRTDAGSKLWSAIDYETFQQIAFHFQHPPWQSNFLIGADDATTGNPWLRWKVSFWDLIQPSFMFMVGMAMPFSYRRRASLGESPFQRTLHALLRAGILVLLGVFLQSRSADSTHWIFPNVLSQIGLGYFFIYLLMGTPRWAQWSALGVILVGTWIGIHVSPSAQPYVPAEVGADPSQGEVFAPPYERWSKNGNAFHEFDTWFLNLFPRPGEGTPEERAFQFNHGGYTTLNFIPSMATMLLGVFCGQFVMTAPRKARTLMTLLLAAIVLTSFGVAAGATCCPIVKRIWTPSWVLFSGGYVVGMFAIFYLLFDLLPLKKLAFPLVVVGMNSIAVYMMGQLLRPWLYREVVQKHFDGAVQSAIAGIDRLLDTPYTPEQIRTVFEPVIYPTTAFCVMWLICWWMYRQRIFIRI